LLNPESGYLCRALWLPLVLAAFWLGGCATSPTPPPAQQTAPAPAVNLAGFPAVFRSGYGDGCASANASRRRDEARFKSEPDYAQGWRDGYDICRRRRN
jgi:hypothetical protein